MNLFVLTLNKGQRQLDMIKVSKCFSLRMQIKALPLSLSLWSPSLCKWRTLLHYYTISLAALSSTATAQKEKRPANRGNAQRTQQESHVWSGQFGQRLLLRRRRRLGSSQLPVQTHKSTFFTLPFDAYLLSNHCFISLHQLTRIKYK